jgi:hypothetical protein
MTRSRMEGRSNRTGGSTIAVILMNCSATTGSTSVAVSTDTHSFDRSPSSQLGTPMALSSSTNPGNSSEDLRAPREDGADRPALRDTSPVHRIGGQDVSLDHRHPVIEVRQHAASQQTAHAGTEHHRMFAALVHEPEFAARQGWAPRVGDYPIVRSSSAAPKQLEGFEVDNRHSQTKPVQIASGLPCAFRAPYARRGLAAIAMAAGS